MNAKRLRRRGYQDETDPYRSGSVVHVRHETPGPEVPLFLQLSTLDDLLLQDKERWAATIISHVTYTDGECVPW